MAAKTYVAGLRAALAIADKRAQECRAEEARHAAGAEHFTPEDNAMWVKLERQCALEAACIAGKILRLIDEHKRSGGGDG